MMRGWLGCWARTLAHYPTRLQERRRLFARFGFDTITKPPYSFIAALIRIKNEDFWIELILRTTCKVFQQVVVIDTGSTDYTLGIIKQLIAEDLPITLVQHQEPSRRFNLIANLVLEQMNCEYFYLIDGDELQFAPFLERLQNKAQELDPTRTWRIAVHHLFVHPENFLRCTKPFCPDVRYRAGRLFLKSKLQLSEIMVNDGIQRTNGLPFFNQENHSIFLEDVFALHCPLNQRSTLATWQGNAEINSAYAGQYRHARYRAREENYVPLPFFPKEILECRYSEHNYFLPAILGAGIPLW